MLKKIKFRSLLGNSWILLLAALLVAGGLTYFMYQYLNAREATLKAEMAGKASHGIAVVVPAQDVPSGTPLASDVFVAREIAPDLVYDDMVRADSFEQFRASKLIHPVRRGLPLRTSDIDALSGRDFSDVVPIGERAVTLEIDMINSNNEMIRPGNHVDIYWVGTAKSAMDYKSGPDGNDTSIQLLLPNILILATGQDVRPRNVGESMSNSNNPAEKSAFASVTVQVPVAEAARLALAQRVGSLRLVLRNSEDKSLNVPRYVSEGQLFSNQPNSKAPAQNMVEMIAGGSASGKTTMLPVDGPHTPNVPPRAAAPVAATPANAMPPASDAEATQAKSSVYEQANAIAQQLQKLDTRSTSGRN
ncbi:Flp pilus assembly protein CpaB [Paraburkholderia hayleyella]|uniref:Flp pilus assembly protein CpaB n=1 Tax=Paraburkholderia hayleyella TaxID=2152889 RepID=UPI00129187B8|nr:Flp pilus assembly protein CpaB [Paraburkholderia hayleyella]